METARGGSGSKLEAFFDFLGLIGLGLALPTGLLICGQAGPALFLEKTLGPFGSPPALLLAFIVCIFFRTLFGSVRRALPVLAGLAVGLACLASVFSLPWLGSIRAAASRFPAFAEPGPAFFAGVAAIVLGTILGQFERGRSLIKILAPLLLALATLVVLAGTRPFPKVAQDQLSVESTLKAISTTLGYKYENPEVEAAVRKVLDDKAKTVAEKEAQIAELTARLQKAEADRQALEQSAADTQRLGAELDSAKAALAKLKDQVKGEAPLLVGGSYAEAVQPMDPTVRDFSVGIASKYPGAFDSPQGSRRPSEAGLRQVALVHSALSSSWKYVSDPGVNWSEYVSPARRTLALGLAGDCDDFAVIVASCTQAIGGRVRIMHGFASSSGHAWAELWLGSGASAAAAISTVAGILGRSPGSIAIDRDENGDQWLILDWRLGELSIKATSLKEAWKGES